MTSMICHLMKQFFYSVIKIKMRKIFLTLSFFFLAVIIILSIDRSSLSLNDNSSENGIDIDCDSIIGVKQMVVNADYRCLVCPIVNDSLIECVGSDSYDNCPYVGWPENWSNATMQKWCAPFNWLAQPESHPSTVPSEYLSNCSAGVAFSIPVYIGDGGFTCNAWNPEDPFKVTWLHGQSTNARMQNSLCVWTWKGDSIDLPDNLCDGDYSWQYLVPTQAIIVVPTPA